MISQCANQTKFATRNHRSYWWSEQDFGQKIVHERTTHRNKPASVLRFVQKNIIKKCNYHYHGYTRIRNSVKLQTLSNIQIGFNLELSTDFRLYYSIKLLNELSIKRILFRRNTIYVKFNTHDNIIDT